MKEMTDKIEIIGLTKNADHIGTNFLPGGPMGLKTKTFNLYKTKDNKYIVTNHYGTELVNARIYETEEELHKDYPESFAWNKYSFPLLG
jgi:hypothetical protein